MIAVTDGFVCEVNDVECVVCHFGYFDDGDYDVDTCSHYLYYLFLL